jgi:hypothetical protein
MIGLALRSASRRGLFPLGLCGLGALLAAPKAAHADGAAVLASVVCAPVASPGRILCDVTISASSGKLVWVDALVVRAPAFARPLRSRVVAESNPAGTASAKLALVATETGKGELQLRVRAVVCHEAPSGQWCGPETALVSGAIEVGQTPPAAP